MNERPKYKVEIVEPVQDKGSVNEAASKLKLELMKKHHRVETNTMTVGDNIARFSALDH